MKPFNPEPQPQIRANKEHQVFKEFNNTQDTKYLKNLINIHFFGF